MFVTDVPGVFHGGALVRSISADRAVSLVEGGAFEGGIVPEAAGGGAGGAQRRPAPRSAPRRWSRETSVSHHRRSSTALTRGTGSGGNREVSPLALRAGCAAILGGRRGSCGKHGFPCGTERPAWMPDAEDA